MKYIIQAKLLILCLLIIGCTTPYNYVSIKKNPVYLDSLIEGSLTEVMTCASESIDENAYDEVFGHDEKIRYRQEIRSIPGANKGSIGLYYINGRILIALVEFEFIKNSTRVRLFAHETDSEWCSNLNSKCVRDKFINAIKVCDK